MVPKRYANHLLPIRISPWLFWCHFLLMAPSPQVEGEGRLGYEQQPASSMPWSAGNTLLIVMKIAKCQSARELRFYS